jgi:hypothetical protein
MEEKWNNKGWGKLHNEELHNLYCSTNSIRLIKSRRMRGARDVARRGANMNAYKVFLGKPKVNRQLRIPRSR